MPHMSARLETSSLARTGRQFRSFVDGALLLAAHVDPDGTDRVAAIAAACQVALLLAGWHHTIARGWRDRQPWSDAITPVTLHAPTWTPVKQLVEPRRAVGSAQRPPPRVPRARPNARRCRHRAVAVAAPWAGGWRGSSLR